MSITKSNVATLKKIEKFQSNGPGYLRAATLKRWEGQFAASQMAALRRKGMIESVSDGIRLSGAGERVLSGRRI